MRRLSGLRALRRLEARRGFKEFRRLKKFWMKVVRASAVDSCRISLDERSLEEREFEILV